MALLAQFSYIITLHVQLSSPFYTTQQHNHPTQDVTKHHSTPEPGHSHAGVLQLERGRPHGRLSP